jgi:hypothetical protein
LSLHPALDKSPNWREIGRLLGASVDGAITIVACDTSRSEATMLQASYEVAYQPLFQDQNPLRFPCDRLGHVDLDSLSPQAIENYLFARALVGRDFAPPAVMAHTE